MQVAQLTLYRVRIPLRQAFKQSVGIREVAENVVVRCRTVDGVEGWGETVARDYVTGETAEGVIARCAALPASGWDSALATAGEVDARLAELGLRDAHAARCALEMALLDALARQRKLSLAALLARDLPELVPALDAGPFRYAGVLGLRSAAATAWAALRLRAYGFASVKIKLGERPDEDARRVRITRRWLGRRVELRADANAAWDTDTALRAGELLAAAGFAGLEQPLAKDRLDETLALRSRLSLPIVLDESVCGEADARAALAQGPAGLVFAIKLAKMGGFLNALRVMRLARESGVPVQLSCQVGESAILSAAGRQLAAMCPERWALEGSFDRHLLADNVIAGDLTFGRGGWAAALAGPGLGIAVDPAAVERLSGERQTLYSSRSGIRQASDT